MLPLSWGQPRAPCDWIFFCAPKALLVPAELTAPWAQECQVIVISQYFNCSELNVDVTDISLLPKIGEGKHIFVKFLKDYFYIKLEVLKATHWAILIDSLRNIY